MCHYFRPSRKVFLLHPEAPTPFGLIKQYFAGPDAELGGGKMMEEEEDEQRNNMTKKNT
jgi:hypothetical protein